MVRFGFYCFASFNEWVWVVWLFGLGLIRLPVVVGVVVIMLLIRFL